MKKSSECVTGILFLRALFLTKTSSFIGFCFLPQASYILTQLIKNQISTKKVIFFIWEKFFSKNKKLISDKDNETILLYMFELFESSS